MSDEQNHDRGESDSSKGLGYSTLAIFYNSSVGSVLANSELLEKYS